jgi:hypothetical protein
MSYTLSGGSLGPTIPLPSASARMNELVAMIRLYIRDFPELNRLIKGEETSNRMIAWAIIDALDDWNTTPPFIGNASIMNFPSISLLREGAVIRILESVGLLQTRNQMSYSDGGISVSVSDKTPLLMNWIQMFRQSYEQKKDRMKASMNIEMGMAGTGTFSEYFVINGIYFPNV